MIDFLNVIIFGVAVLIASSLTTFFHELGHAIPALIFTKEKDVTVIIGSYGQTGNYYKFNLGRLKIFFRFNLLNWRAGLCSFEEPVSYKQDIIITLGGPVMSLVLATAIGVLISTVPIANIWVILGVIYILLGIFDFITNMIPNEFKSEDFPGKVFISDGKHFSELRALGDAYQRFNIIIRDNTVEKSEELEKLYNISSNKTVGFYALREKVEKNKFKEAFEFSQILYNTSGPEESEFEVIGDMYYGLGQKEDALKYYTTYLYHNIYDFEVKNKKAKILFEIGNEIDALKLFRNSIFQNRHQNIEAYLQTARILIQLKPEEAKFYLDEAQTLEAKNPEIYVEFGRLYEKLNNDELAKKYYKLARHYGSDFHGLEYKIETL